MHGVKMLKFEGEKRISMPVNFCLRYKCMTDNLYVVKLESANGEIFVGIECSKTFESGFSGHELTVHRV